LYNNTYESGISASKADESTGRYLSTTSEFKTLSPNYRQQKNQNITTAEQRLHWLCRQKERLEITKLNKYVLQLK